MAAASAFAFPQVTVAAVQCAPVFLDAEATVEIVRQRTAEAANLGAQLVVFSEAFVPGFPSWALVLAPVLQRDLAAALYHQALEVPGPLTSQLSMIAEESGVYLSVGVTERSRRSVGTMWNANLVFGPDGSLLNHRRKLVPTWAEKLVWSNGDGFGLGTFDTSLGRLGALICGENTNPLARFALINEGEQLHIAPYPPAWPTRPATASDNYPLAHAINLRSAAHSFEGKLVTVAASGLVDPAEVEAVTALDSRAGRDLAGAPPPVTAIVGPDGQPIAEPLIGTEGILLAEVSLGRAILEKQIHDVSGGYQRFDVFSFAVDRWRPHEDEDR